MCSKDKVKLYTTAQALLSASAESLASPSNDDSFHATQQSPISQAPII